MHLQCCFLLQVAWGFSFQIYDTKKLTKLVKFILEKHNYAKFCLKYLQKITKVFGKKDWLDRWNSVSVDEVKLQKWILNFQPAGRHLDKSSTHQCPRSANHKSYRSTCLSRGDPDRISPVSIGQPRPRTTQWKAERTGRFLGAIGGVAGGWVGVGGRGVNRENIGWGRREKVCNFCALVLWRRRATLGNGGAEIKEQEEGQKLCDCQFLLRVGCRARRLLASVCKVPS